MHHLKSTLIYFIFYTNPPGGITLDILYKSSQNRHHISLVGLSVSVQKKMEYSVLHRHEVLYSALFVGITDS